jgi:L-asparaginase II
VPRTQREKASSFQGGAVDPNELNAAPAALVQVRRDGRIESVHRGHVAVVDVSGRLVARAGEPSLLVYPRSSFKPFQALPVVESGAFARAGLPGAALALAAGSHGGTDAHAALAASILAAAGATPDDLRCGTHTPFDRPTADALRARGETPGPLRHNCSGKHAAMLLLARFLEAPFAGYTERTHPVQRRILERFEALVGGPLPDATPSVDGCSAPNPRLPLALLAHAFALLGRGEDAWHAPSPALAAIRDAMREHPDQVAGEGLLDTVLMRALPGSVTKIGAEAVHAIAIPERGWGIAIKVEDGSERALGPATVSVLRELGILGAAQEERLGDFAGSTIRNHAGLEVGDIRGVARLVREPA